MEENKYDGYISSIYLNGKTYGLKAVVFKAKPIICSRCGYTLELDSYGKGTCPACGTNYNSRIVIEES